MQVPMISKIHFSASTIPGHEAEFDRQLDDYMCRTWHRPFKTLPKRIADKFKGTLPFAGFPGRRSFPFITIGPSLDGFNKQGLS